MKKYFFMGMGMAAMCLIFYSCTVLQSLTHVENNGFICSDYGTQPPNSIEKSRVLKMVKNYYQNQYSVLHNRNNAVKLALPSTEPLDSRAVFFNLDTIKKLIYFIEKASKNFSKIEKKNLGLNIYFGSYPESFQKFKFGHNYTNRHTLVFLPSVFDQNNHIARDFDLFRTLNYPSDSIPYLTKEFFTTPFPNIMCCIIGGNSITDAAEGSDPMGSQNDATGTPPPATHSNPLLLITEGP